ncbi:uncharacterized protein FRV6_12132 [Fusarium oxysporum]|uniref:Uncharacterized protein n=1 Tax=Fusarium oxysporum TaxID=5507 RepID=A0A2H3TK20_FUSOX|nr:uncharacterized protein FRV6_12132 [Fusarium oxysporum]
MSFVYDSTIIHSDSAYVTQEIVNRFELSSHHPGRSQSWRISCATSIVLGDRNAQGDDVDAVARNVAGMVFLGTPFAGSNAAKWGELVRKIFNVVKKTDQNTLKTLKENSHDLQEL